MRRNVAAVCGLLLSFAFGRLEAQGPPPARDADVSSPEAVVAALYDVISGPKGQKRDWDRFRTLFAPGARLIPTGARPDGTRTIRVLTPDEFAAQAGRMEEVGFVERGIAHRTERFGNVAHVFSTYESRRAASDPTPFARGINSIQLMHDGKRWWTVTIFWDSERTGQPDSPEIPARWRLSRSRVCRQPFATSRGAAPGLCYTYISLRVPL